MPNINEINFEKIFQRVEKEKLYFQGGRYIVEFLGVSTPEMPDNSPRYGHNIVVVHTKIKEVLITLPAEGEFRASNEVDQEVDVFCDLSDGQRAKSNLRRLQQLLCAVTRTQLSGPALAALLTADASGKRGIDDYIGADVLVDGKRTLTKNSKPFTDLSFAAAPQLKA